MRHLIVQLLCLAALAVDVALAQDNPSVTIQVDATQDLHPIDPRIYGVNHADAATLGALNSPLNRFGGNRRSRYNWLQNTDSTASDYFFESIPHANVAGGAADDFVGGTLAGPAQAMVTVPMIDYIAMTDAGRNILCSFSVAKYPGQTATDPFDADCGNGVTDDGPPPVFVVGNNPLDANMPNGPAFEQTFVQHLVSKWGAAAGGGVRYYLLDNEPGIWHETHRDVHPTGASYDEIRQKMIAYAIAIKTVDPGALVAGPEEFGWPGYFLSGLDLQTCDKLAQMGDFSCYANPPDRANHGGVDFVVYLLDQLRAAGVAAGGRLLDVFTLHYYPQAAGVDSAGPDPGSAATQELRSRSTRSLWDPTYVDESYIGEPVRLIPRMREWVASVYPGTPIGITEYRWGEANDMNVGTAQADVLGIFGREGLDLATYYTDAPLPLGTAVAKAFQLYRNYDGAKSTFGDISVRAAGSHGSADPLADHVGVYAAMRSADGALTLMVVNKYLTGNTPLQVGLAGFSAGPTAQVWRLEGAGSGAISRLPDVPVGPAGFATAVPPRSVTLFVIAPQSPAGLPTLGLGLNQDTFAAGDTMRLTATLTPGATPVLVDVYIVIWVPGAGFFSPTAGGVVAGLAPIARGITPAPFSGEIVTYQFTGAEPSGSYMWVAGLTQAGTPTLIGTAAMRPFSFAP